MAPRISEGVAPGLPETPALEAALPWRRVRCTRSECETVASADRIIRGRRKVSGPSGKWPRPRHAPRPLQRPGAPPRPPECERRAADTTKLTEKSSRMHN